MFVFCGKYSTIFYNKWYYSLYKDTKIPECGLHPGINFILCINLHDNQTAIPHRPIEDGVCLFLKE